MILRTIALLCVSSTAPGAAMQDAGRMMVVYSSAVPAYVEALEGIRDRLGGSPALVNLKVSGEQELEEGLRRNAGKPVIAVGAEASRLLAGLKPQGPVVSTMILRAEGAHSSAAIYLDVPLAGILKELQRMYPAKTRLGIIRNVASPEQEKGRLAAHAREQGFTTAVADCAGPGELLPAFLSLKGKADFVLCFADSSLYNSATVEPLLLASLKHKLPIVGFSAGFVRAGAAIGIFPDFRDVGRQTVEVALRTAEGKDAPGESPRKLKAVVNRRVLRLLGMESPAFGEFISER